MHQVALSFQDGKTLFLEVKPNERLLDAAYRHGIKIPMDCREGVCATCQGQCESGRYQQDYVDEEALSAADLAQHKILACQTTVQSNASFYFDFDSSLCNAPPTSRVQSIVKQVALVSDSSALLYLDASSHPSPIAFLPGQYARLRVPGSEAWRAYSFAHAPRADNQLQFLIRLLPDGVMSHYLRQHWQAGDVLELEAPLGAFYQRHIDKPVVMVAGGTGLSAFLGMLDQLAEQAYSEHPITLYYGVNKEGDLCESQRLAAYATRIPSFSYHPVVMSPSASWTGKCGVIPEHFDAQQLQQHSTDMYLCGPPPMVDAVKHWLQQHGCEQTKLYMEKFADSASLEKG